MSDIKCAFVHITWNPDICIDKEDTSQVFECGTQNARAAIAEVARERFILSDVLSNIYVEDFEGESHRVRVRMSVKVEILDEYYEEI